MSIGTIALALAVLWTGSESSLAGDTPQPSARHAPETRHAPAAHPAPLADLAAHGEIPYFARRFGVSCDQCHVHPPKSNDFGEEFVRRGYRIPGVRPARSIPFAVWASSRWETRDHQPDPSVHVNRVELISGGELTSWLSYFVEWRTISFESRADGTLRDRSGRFEDIFLLGQWGDWEAMVGQFRQVQQVDVSRRLTLSEPVVLSSSLPGREHADARRQSLRGFAPSARSPVLRVGRDFDLAGGWGWHTAVAVPFPGEFSLPLTREARREASNELELDPKGLFVESFARRGVTSLGGHLFYDHDRRWLAHAVGTLAMGSVHWEAMAGGARDRHALRGRWSVEGHVFPHRLVAAGARVEDRAGDGLGMAWLPTLNLHFPGTTYTIRLTVEQRIQSGRNATLVEVGTVF